MNVVNFKEVTLSGNKEGAEKLRELAEAVERGDIQEFFFAGNEVSEQGYVAFGSWDDAWRLAGALEYAKHRVLRSYD